MAIRSGRGKSAINWVLLGLILFGLGGWGVTNFSGRSSGSIGSVGGVKISADEYARGLRNEVQATETRTGQRLDPEQIRASGIAQSVQRRLIMTAALEAQAGEIGLSAGDAQVADEILAAPAFQNGGKFDRAIYADALRREGMNEKTFEHDVRMDLARMVIQNAVSGGVVAPEGMVKATTGWLTETRDIGWTEFTDSDLTQPVSAPDDSTLKSWWEANPDRFSAPRTRHFTYVWLTPDMLAGKEQVDEDTLRALYKQHEDEYQKPARRMVDRLVFPDMAAAEAARQALDNGTSSFDDLVTARGLTRADTDLGEVTEAQLGSAGAQVFAADENGIVGPVATDLGPALFSVNAILDPVDIPFEEARGDLMAEAASGNASRDIARQTPEVADLLAGGATLEDLAGETDLELGQIDLRDGETPQPGSIASYPAFRAQAEDAQEGDYPELFELDDGGIFALRLDKVTPEAVIPLDQAREQVIADWTATETHKRLLALADERKLDAMADKGPPPARTATGLGRDGAVDGVPAEVIAAGFTLPRPGDASVVDAEGRVFLVTLAAVHDADPDGARTQLVNSAVARSLSLGLSQDVFAYYVQALIDSHGLKIDPRMTASVEGQLR